MTDTFAPVTTHPLEPLNPREISQASAIVIREQNLTSSARFVYIELNESKDELIRRWVVTAVSGIRRCRAQ